ncbi:hypothetical protein LW974_17960, partial [Erwinia amylovora]|nr:hypothetical protein [Erwinia amylovora]
KRLGRFMPRRYSRLTLLVTDVRVQRLQDIIEADIFAEGIADLGDGGPAMLREAATRLDWTRRWFTGLWNSINGPDAWAANPWVVA